MPDLIPRPYCFRLLAIAVAARRLSELQPTQIAGRWNGGPVIGKTSRPIIRSTLSRAVPPGAVSAWMRRRSPSDTALKVDYVEPLGDPQSDNTSL